MCGVFIGIGEIVGGAGSCFFHQCTFTQQLGGENFENYTVFFIGGIAFGILGSRIPHLGRDSLVLFGYIIHVVSFYLIFLNLPNDSPLHEATEEPYLKSK